MITLEGLNTKQKAIADLLWNETTMEEVDELKCTLGKDVSPSKGTYYCCNSR